MGKILGYFPYRPNQLHAINRLGGSRHRSSGYPGTKGDNERPCRVFVNEGGQGSHQFEGSKAG